MATLSEPTACTMTSADEDSDAAALPANLRPLPPTLSGGGGVAEEPIDVDSTGLDSLLSAMGSGHVREGQHVPQSRRDASVVQADCGVDRLADWLIAEPLYRW